MVGLYLIFREELRLKRRMQEYTVFESYKLPSLGKVYNVPVNPDVKIRSMTTEEEMRRVAAVDTPYKNMSDMIDACLIEDPGISSYDMCIGDYQFLLHKLRVVTYGPEYHISNVCIYCGCKSDDIVNLEELPIMEYDEGYEDYREFDLPKSGHHIRLRPQTPRMLDKISQRVKEFKIKSNGATKDMALTYTIEELIESIDGGFPNPLKIEDWIRNLPMADTNTIIQYATKMNNYIGVNIDLTCTCNVCGLDFKTTMKSTSEFFRPTLNI